MMESICADLPIWNQTQTWNALKPDLPLCFQETILVWIPCFYLLLILPYHMMRALQHKRKRNDVKYEEREESSNDEVDNFGSHLNIILNGIKTPNNSISSLMSNESKNKLKKSITMATNEMHKDECCLDTFPLRQFRSSFVTGMKQTTTLALILMCLIELLYGLFTDFKNKPIISHDPTTEPIFESVTPGIKIAVFFIILAIQYLHWRQRIVSSISLLLFWFLFMIQVILNTRSLVFNYYDLQDDPSTMRFNHYQDRNYVGMKLFTNCLVIIEFILILLPERPLDKHLHNTDGRNRRNQPEKINISRRFVDMKYLDQCPLNNASVLSRLLFGWTTNIIWNTFRRPPLKYDHLWSLIPDHWSIVNAARFSKNFLIKRIKSNIGNNDQYRFVTNGLMWPLVKTFWPSILFNAFLKLCSSFLPYLNALFLSWLIKYLEQNIKHREPLWHGIVYVVLMLFTPILDTLIHVQYNFQINIILLKVKASLCDVIYRKGLRLSSSGREKFTTGEIINLMAIDAARVGEFFPQLNETWSVPLQVVFALYLLWQQLGIASLAGLILMIILMPINSYIVRQLRRISQNVMDYKDRRLRLMNDILSGIKVLKLYAWEDSFCHQINIRRNNELKMLKHRLYFQAAVVFIFTSASFFITVACFTTFILIDPKHNRLDPEKAFVSLTLFNQIRTPLMMLPRVIAFYSMFVVSLKRLNRFMCGDELSNPHIHENNNRSILQMESGKTKSSTNDIIVENGSFTWNYGMKPTLNNIDLKIQQGSLVAIIGSVGCGKSSLISALLGDMKQIDGNVTFNRSSISYVAQQAWIQNATIRENILFMNSYNERKYETILDACALRPDLSILSGHDRTEIGEKGINLSGGQKQRVAIARAVYTNSRIYLLDDPLSALDAHVGQHIFDTIIGPNGLLRDRTRLLVTHRLSILSQCDQIIVMDNGTIVESGTYSQLIENNNGQFSTLLQNYNSTNMDENENTMINVEDVDETKHFLDMCFKEIDELSSVNDEEEDEECEIDLAKPKTNRVVSFDIENINTSVEKITENDGKLQQNHKITVDEQSESNSISLSCYWNYFHRIGWMAIVGIILFQLASTSCNIGSAQWLSYWSEMNIIQQDYNQTLKVVEDNRSNIINLSIYIAIGLCECFFTLFMALVIAFSTLKASGCLHREMLERLFRAPLSYFNTNPIGRILNRFAKDIDTCDTVLNMNIRNGLFTASRTIGAIIVIAIGTPPVLIAIIPLVILYLLVQSMYLPTSRQLRRIESTTRSPIYSHFGESLNGSSTIRAFKREMDFIIESNHRIDQNNVANYVIYSTAGWIMMRLEFLGYMVVFANAIYCLVARDTISPSDAGLTLTYSFTITRTLNQFIMMATELENSIVSYERCLEYTNINMEAQYRNNEEKNLDWPSNGLIEFQNYSTRYRTGLDLVLKSISFTINPRERIGIVGRTGAGKSSITLALFRIIESVSGSIMIDGRDISKLSLYTLRSRISIIPQDPILFTGTVRMNLDPFNHCTDEQIWSALKMTNLYTFIWSLTERLEYQIVEGGENVSVGQRQLICLTRALLRQTKILVLDEATAAVDMETDSILQQTIRSQFNECTIMTIAHRIETIIDYDRIMVLDDGHLIEFDTPKHLLDDHSSTFYSLAKEAGVVC